MNINSSYLNSLFEIHYIEKGCNDDLLYCDVTGNCYDKTFENKITYLSIPFIFKFSIPNDYISPFFVIGPRVDLKLSYDAELMENTYEEFKDVVFGYDYGFGVETKVKELTISLEYRFSKDLQSSWEHKVDYSWLDNDYTIRIFNESSQILLGVKYKF